MSPDAAERIRTKAIKQNLAGSENANPEKYDLEGNSEMTSKCKQSSGAISENQSSEIKGER
jgi:hypothetical protein